jgi:hypothetical protein
MGKYLKINYLIILVIIFTYFQFDKNMITGTDNAWYLDLSYLISNQKLFLVDYFDYRLPVFSFVFSPIYKFNFSESQNVYILLCLVYSFYILVIYKIYNLVSKNQSIALFSSILTFFSISSRTFDSARNICQPLFHHTLELISIILILYVYKHYFTIKKSLRLFLISLASFIFFINFSGRQVQIFPILLFIFYISTIFFKKEVNKKEVIIDLLFFSIGIIIALSILFFIFYIPGINYFYQLKYWLYDIPLNIHTNSMGSIQFLRRIGGIISSFFGYFTGFYLPAINFLLFFLLISFILILKNYSKLNNTFLTKNKDFISICLCIAISHCINTFPTGAGAPRYQTNIFTLYGLGLSFFLLNFKSINISKYIYTLLLIPVVYLNYIFLTNEYNSFKTSQSQENKLLFNNAISIELKKNIIIDKTEVLVLGGQSIVGRIAKYKPYLGYVSDVTLFSHSKKNPKLFMNDFQVKFAQIEIVYKTPDYPNLPIIGDDSTNNAFLFIEKQLKDNFKIIKIINPLNSYPYTYNKPVIIYKRK